MNRQKINELTANIDLLDSNVAAENAFKIRVNNAIPNQETRLRL